MVANAPDVGYSIPMARYPKLEISRSFNAGTSYVLEDLVKTPEYNNTVMRPFGVDDANFPGPLIKEYIFGPDTPMPKSLWNTLDFEPGAGPLANNTQ